MHNRIRPTINASKRRTTWRSAWSATTSSTASASARNAAASWKSLSTTEWCSVELLQRQRPRSLRLACRTGEGGLHPGRNHRPTGDSRCHERPHRRFRAVSLLCRNWRLALCHATRRLDWTCLDSLLPLPALQQRREAERPVGRKTPLACAPTAHPRVPPSSLLWRTG